jgi:hypothetical protein
MAILKFLHSTYLAKNDEQFTNSDNYGILTFVHLEVRPATVLRPSCDPEKIGALYKKGGNQKHDIPIRDTGLM